MPRILFVTQHPHLFAEINELLTAKGHRVHVVPTGGEAIDLIKGGLNISVVIAPLRMNENASGLHVLTEYELTSPGKGKILVIDRFSKNIATIANYLGAICVAPQIPANELLSKIESLLASRQKNDSRT